MDMKIALAGNPNCGKTTLFNDLTGSNQYVGNWPGVTVEKKEGRLKGRKDIVIQDLPGIYSLSPYTLEEVVARNYLVKEKPDAILNIVDGTNIERNLYLTTQLIELGLPVVVAVNMMDLVRRNGDQIDARKLSDALGCQVVEISALKGEGGVEAAELAAKMAQQKRAAELPHVFTGSVEHAIAHIEESIQGMVDDRYLRWYAVKVFERDEKVLADLNLSTDLRAHLEDHIVDCEKELDDDAEFTLNGSEASYRDIKNALDDGDVLVTLEFDDDNIVTKVTAQLKNVKGTLKSADDKRIVVVDDDDNRMALTVTRLVECEFNGEEVSYARFQGMFEDTENAVMAEVELDDEGVVEKIVAVEGSETEGKVVELNSDKIIIEDAAGVEHEYKLESFIRGYLNGEELFPASRIFEDARDKDATVELAFSSRGHVNRIYVTLD
mgnify:CR=1 FL=1